MAKKVNPFGQAMADLADQQIEALKNKEKLEKLISKNKHYEEALQEIYSVTQSYFAFNSHIHKIAEIIEKALEENP